MEESDLKSEMEHKKDSAARMSLRASDFKFGESDIEKGEISEMELKTELTSKATDAPLSFIISTDAAKIKIQLYDDIGEKKINALMQGINAVTNSVLGIDAAQDASFSQKNNGSFKSPLPFDEDEECFNDLKSRFISDGDNKTLTPVYFTGGGSFKEITTSDL